MIYTSHLESLRQWNQCGYDGGDKECIENFGREISSDA
jgi:hypothetical protein